MEDETGTLMRAHSRQQKHVSVRSCFEYDRLSVVKILTVIFNPCYNDCNIVY